MKKFTGFTLVELAITLTIAAILVSLAAPSFRELLLNNRLTSTANNFVAAANLARSEAIKRGRPATLCTSSNSMEAEPTCTGGTDWGVGYLVWVDSDGSGGVNGDERLRVGDAVGGTGLTFTGTTDQFVFDSRGAVGNTGTLDICDDRDDEVGRQISIGATGRLETNAAFDGC